MENLNPEQSRLGTLSLRSLADKKNIERIIGATAAILVTNVLKYLMSLNLVSGWFFHVFGLPPSVYFYNNLRYIVIAILLIGYGFILYLLYKRFVVTLPLSRRIFYGTLAVVGAATIFSLNVYLLPLQPEAKVLIPTKDWSDRIAKSQAPSGGIREKADDPSFPTQVWTTAQALTGVLADQKDLDDTKARVIKTAFGYIENARHPAPVDTKLTDYDEGWGLFEKSKKSTTEIAGWVTLANIASLESKAKVWNPTEIPIIVQRIQRDLALIVERQGGDGGWRPIKEDGPKFTRTYSTAIALWSLIEARRSKLVHEVVGNTYDPNIQNGIDWLLKNYTTVKVDGKDQKLGWVPNPNRGGQREQFDGLTAQVLFILSRIEGQPGFDALKNNENYLEYKRAFIMKRDLAGRFVCSNDRIHDFDLSFTRDDGTLDFVLEGSTILWFPWSYAELTVLSNDTALSPQERAQAASLRKGILDSKVDDINKFVHDEMMYVLAENLYCFSISDEYEPSGNQ
jgi:hypothetical protein